MQIILTSHADLFISEDKMYPTGAERIVDPTKFLDTACKYRSWEQKLAQ